MGEARIRLCGHRESDDTKKERGEESMGGGGQWIYLVLEGLARDGLALHETDGILAIPLARLLSTLIRVGLRRKAKANVRANNHAYAKQSEIGEPRSGKRDRTVSASMAQVQGIS